MCGWRIGRGTARSNDRTHLIKLDLLTLLGEESADLPAHLLDGLLFLMVAFASGGRRRSEVAGLRLEQLTKEPPIIRDDGPPLPSLAIHLDRTKTSGVDQDEIVYLTGRPVEALNAWLQAAKIETGSVFRKIDRWGNVSRRALDPKSVNGIVKQRAELAGLEPAEFSAHGLRSGYLTEAANRGIPLPEAMEQSRHRSVRQASSYYNSAPKRKGSTIAMRAEILDKSVLVALSGKTG